MLILDDSTSAVDTATDRKIREAFARHIPGTTKLIISQRVSSIQDADRILVLENGKISGFGTHEELLEQKGRYYQLYTGKNGVRGISWKKAGGNPGLFRARKGEGRQPSHKIIPELWRAERGQKAKPHPEKPKRRNRVRSGRGRGWGGWGRMKPGEKGRYRAGKGRVTPP